MSVSVRRRGHRRRGFDGLSGPDRHGHLIGLDIELVTQQPATIRTFDESERWKRGLVLRADVMAADHIKAEAPELTKIAAAGITTRSCDAAWRPVQRSQRARERRHADGVSDRGRHRSAAKRRQRRQVSGRAARAVPGCRAAMATRRRCSAPSRSSGRRSSMPSTRRGLEARYAKSPVGCGAAARSTARSMGSNEALGGGGAVRQRGSPWRSRRTSSARSCGRSTWPRNFSSRRSSPVDRRPIWRPRISKAANAKGDLQPELSNEVPRARPRCRRTGTRAATPRARAEGRVRPGEGGCAVRVLLVGTDEHVSDFLKNAARAVKEGLTPDAAIRALTLDAATDRRRRRSARIARKGQDREHHHGRRRSVRREHHEVTLVLIDGPAWSLVPSLRPESVLGP